jgi:hypothetical protein
VIFTTLARTNTHLSAHFQVKIDHGRIAGSAIYFTGKLGAALRTIEFNNSIIFDLNFAGIVVASINRTQPDKPLMVATFDNKINTGFIINLFGLIH